MPPPAALDAQRLREARVERLSPGYRHGGGRLHIGTVAKLLCCGDGRAGRRRFCSQLAQQGHLRAGAQESVQAGLALGGVVSRTCSSQQAELKRLVGELPAVPWS